MKLLFIVSLLGLSTFLYSQNTFIEFNIYIAIGSPSQGKLIITDSISYWDQIFAENVIVSENPLFIKKRWEDKIYCTEQVFSHTFYVKDSLHNMKWQLTGDTKTILDEKCNSATTHFRGRNYTAYYTTSLPYSDGPWKFGGLPGVILEVKSDDNLYQFNAVKVIKNYTGKIELVNIIKYKFIDWDEFVEKYIVTINNIIKSMKSTGTSLPGEKTTLKIDAREIIYPKVQTGVGVSF